MNKKTLVIALLALQLGSQVYASSGGSTQAINTVLQLVQPSAATWAVATNASNTTAPLGGVGPDLTLSQLQASYTTTPPDYNTAWYAIITATSFFNLTALVPQNQSLNSFYATTLTATPTSANHGPTITYFGPLNSSAVCALYDPQAKLIPPTYQVVSGTYANVLPPPLTVTSGSSVTLGYSAYPIFASAVKPPVNGIYYLVCAAYTVASNVATGLTLTPANFTITW